MIAAQKTKANNISRYLLALVLSFSCFALSGDVVSYAFQKSPAQTEISVTVARQVVRATSYHKEKTQVKSYSCRISLHLPEQFNSNSRLSRKYDAAVKREFKILATNILCYHKPERQNVKYAPRSLEDIHFIRG